MRQPKGTRTRLKMKLDYPMSPNRAYSQGYPGTHRIMWRNHCREREEIYSRLPLRWDAREVEQDKYGAQNHSKRGYPAFPDSLPAVMTIGPIGKEATALCKGRTDPVANDQQCTPQMHCKHCIAP